MNEHPTLDISSPQQARGAYTEFHWTPEDTERFWSFESQFPERYFTYRNGEEIVRQLRRFLPDDQPILDYGCGAGHLLRQLLAGGYRAAGADTSQGAIESVNNELGSDDNFIGAFLPDSISEQRLTFGAVLATEVVEHLYDDALDGMLESIRGMVKDKGHIIFTTPNEENLSASQLLCPCCSQVFHRWQHVRSWTKDSLSTYLEERGFTIVSAFTTDYRMSLRRKGKRWWTIRKRYKYLTKPHKRRPHLTVVCTPTS